MTQSPDPAAGQSNPATKYEGGSIVIKFLPTGARFMIRVTESVRRSSGNSGHVPRLPGVTCTEVRGGKRYRVGKG